MLVACGILEPEEIVRPSLKTVGFFNEARIDRFLDKQRARKRFEKRFFGGGGRTTGKRGHAQRGVLYFASLGVVTTGGCFTLEAKISSSFTVLRYFC